MRLRGSSRSRLAALLTACAACSSSDRPPASPDVLPGSDAGGGGGDAAAPPAAARGKFERVATVTCAGGCPTRYFASEQGTVTMTDVFRAFQVTVAGGAAKDLAPSNASFSIPESSGACVAGGALFLLGGGGNGLFGAFHDPTWRGLDLTSRAWSTGSSAWYPHRAAVTAADGACVAVGGALNQSSDLGTRRAMRFDPSARAWTALPDLPEPVQSAAIAAVGKRILVAGGSCDKTAGCASPGAPKTGAWLLDLGATSPAWTDAPAMPAARSGARAASLGDRFYVLGGAAQPVETISWAPGEAAWTGHGDPIASDALLHVLADGGALVALARGAADGLDVLRWQP